MDADPGVLARYCSRCNSYHWARTILHCRPVPDSATTGLVAVTEAATMLCLALLYRRLLWAQLAGRRRRPRHRSVGAILVGAAERRPAGAGCRRGPARGGRLAAILTGLAAWCVALRPILPAWRAVRRDCSRPGPALLGPLSAYGSLGRIVRRQPPGHTTGGLAGPDPGGLYTPCCRPTAPIHSASAAPPTVGPSGACWRPSACLW